LKKFIQILFLGSLFFISTPKAHTQNVKTSELKPLLLDRSILSGVGLQKIDLKDTPDRDFFQKNLYRGKDIGVYVVSSESWKIPFERFWFDEFIYMLHGSATVLANESEINLPGRSFIFAPKDFPGNWEVKTGNNFHYELSVITNKRSDSTAVSKLKKPFVFDQTLIEGSNIQFDANGEYKEVIADGIELDIFLFAEKPQEKLNWINETEQLIHILSGQISLTDLDGTTNTFYTGDFFVLPENYRGHKKSEGHSLIKYFSVQKTKELD